MSATNLIEIIKRHFGVLVRILILYACDNEKVSSGTKDCAAKPECSDYGDLDQSDCDDTYIVYRWPKECISGSESNTNCDSDTALCWIAANCEWYPISKRYKKTTMNSDVTEVNFGTKYYQTDCSNNYSSW